MQPHSPGRLSVQHPQLALVDLFQSAQALFVCGHPGLVLLLFAGILQNLRPMRYGVMSVAVKVSMYRVRAETIPENSWNGRLEVRWILMPG